MATHHQGLTKVGEYWHYSLSINGQRLHGSTRAKDLPTAKRVLEDRRREAVLNQCGVHRVPTLADIVKQSLTTTIVSKSGPHRANARLGRRDDARPDLRS